MVAETKPNSSLSLGVLNRPRHAVACTHCGAIVPAGLVDPRSSEQFCCDGCRSAFGIARACRLDSPPQRPGGPLEAGGSATGAGSFAELDDPAFTRVFVRPRPDGLSSVDLLVEGVHCAGCVAVLERLPRIVPGVIEAVLNFRLATLRVVFDPSRTSVSTIARAIDAMGYRPHPARDRSAEQARRLEERHALIRIGVAGACAGNVMIFAFALYGGVFGGIQPQFELLFRGLSAAVGTLCLAWPGRAFFRNAWAAVRTRTVNLDVPICFALGAGGVMGVVNTVLNRGEIYFDSVTAIVFLLLIGRFIQQRQQRRAADAVELLFSLIPSRVRRVEGDAAHLVPVEALAVGDLVEVLAGDSVPVDGVVESGASHVDESLLTGESTPIEVGPGALVHAGSANLSGVLRVRTQATGRDTRAGRLMGMIEECAQRRPPISHFTDRVSRWFVVGVIVASLVTFVVWLQRDPAHAIDHATSMLIVTCPCMLGLAAPLVMATSIGRAARQGILIKGADVLESLSTPGTLILDKTGTVTQGRAALARREGDAQAIQLLALLETRSTHPLARAIVQGVLTAQERDLAPQSIADVEQTTGGGIRGTVQGRLVAAGTRAFLSSLRVPLDARAEDLERAVAQDGLTPILIAVDSRIVAAVGVGDPVRPDARESVQRLIKGGWNVELLSGDHPSSVRAAGATLGLEERACQGGVTPEGKLAVIERRTRERTDGRPIVMVGDGVNDSAALAAASVGIAVHGGSEASLSAADVYLSRPGLAPILDAIDGGRRAMGTIRLTLWASLLYNLIAGSFTLAGQIAPWIAAILMPLNSLTVTLIAVSTPAFRAKKRAIKEPAP